MSGNRQECIVTKCPSNRKSFKEGSKVKFFPFPIELTQGTKWKQILSVIVNKENALKSLCSLHFLQSDFTINATGNLVLNNNAIPFTNLDLDLVGNNIITDTIQDVDGAWSVGAVRSNNREHRFFYHNIKVDDVTPFFLDCLKKSLFNEKPCKEYISLHIPSKLDDAYLEKLVIVAKRNQVNAIKNFKNATKTDKYVIKRRLYLFVEGEKNRIYSQIKTNSFGRCRLCLHCFKKTSLLLFSTQVSSGQDATIQDCLVTLLPSMSDNFQPTHEICNMCYQHMMITLYFFKHTLAVQDILSTVLKDQPFIFNEPKTNKSSSSDINVIDTDYKSCTMEAPLFEKTLNRNLDYFGDFMDDRVAVSADGEDLQRENATGEYYKENQMINMLNQQQNDVLNKVMAKLRPIKIEDDLSEVKCLSNDVDPIENLDVSTVNVKEENDIISDYSEETNNSNNFGNIERQEDFIELIGSSRLNADDRYINMLEDLPPSNNIVALPSGAFDISQFTEEVSFADINIISLKENSSGGRIILLGKEDGFLKNQLNCTGFIDGISDRHSDDSGSEHVRLNNILDDHLDTKMILKEEDIKPNFWAYDGENNKNSELSPLGADQCNLKNERSPEKSKNDCLVLDKKKTETEDLPDIKHIDLQSCTYSDLSFNNSNRDSQFAELGGNLLPKNEVDETDAVTSDVAVMPDIPSRDPYTLDCHLNVDQHRPAINNVLNEDIDGLDREGYTVDSQHSFDEYLSEVSNLENDDCNEIIESTLIGELDNHEDIVGSQFLVSTLGISNPEALKADCSPNLKVVSLDFNVAKEKRILFIGGLYCKSCNRTRRKCDCAMSRKTTGGMCEKCGKIVRGSSYRLRRHMTECEGTIVSNKCDRCNMVFLTKTTYNSHLRRIADAPVCNYIQCNICLVKFTKTAFREHVVEHPNFLCPKCGRSFTTSLMLNTHVRHTCENSGSAEKKMCQVCGKLIAPHYLRSHIKRHTLEKKEVCEICKKRYLFPRELKKHMMKSHGAKTLACNICDKKFSFRDALKAHVKVVHARKPVAACEICNIRFARNDYYRFHLARHHGGSAILPKSQYGGSKKRKNVPSVCSICKKICDNRRSLGAHYKRHFIPRLKCRFCHMTFANDTGQKRHEKLHENPDYKFSCKICFARNKSGSELRKHMKKSHSKKPKIFYQCYHCNESFTKKYLLLHHLGNMHRLRENKEKI